MKNFSQAYITEQDRYIVGEWLEGSTMEQIGADLKLAPNQVQALYEQAVNKASTLVPWKKDSVLERMIDEFLIDIGVYKCMSGAKELAAAIHLGMMEPELMDNMVSEFYPALGKKLHTTDGTARVHISEVVKDVYRDRRRKGEDVTFYQRIGMFDAKTFRMKPLIEEAIYYIVENSAEYSQRKTSKG